MDVLLLEDVYNLGRAGEIKKVANGYGRNFLIPQGMALPATPAAVEMAEGIAEKADKQRSMLNEQMDAVAQQVEQMQLLFPARAGETGKLYGSVTTTMIAEQLSEKTGIDIDKRQIHAQPLRLLGMHRVGVRLTIDVIPEFDVVVYREGENPENYMIAAEELAAEAAPPAEEEMEAIVEASPEGEAEMEAEADVEAEAAVEGGDQADADLSEEN